MTIGFDGSRAFKDIKTGTENYSFQLLTALRKIDKANRYIIYLRPGNKVSGEWPANFQFQTLNFKRLWTQVGLSIETFKDPLDILFTPAHTLPLIRKPGLKTVMTVHDLGAEYLPLAHQLKQRLYLGFITKFQLKGATKLIAVSNSTKKDLIRKAGVNPKNIKVIYEGGPPPLEERFTKNSSKSDDLRDILSKYDLKKREYYLFVGTIQPRKNLARLIEAFASLVSQPAGPADSQPHSTSSEVLLGLSGAPRSSSPASLQSPTGNLDLVIAGRKGWREKEIYALPAKLGIKDRVKFVGRVADWDLPSLYKGALGLAYPSLYEGFGLPILEAFGYDCPVLTSNVSSMPEVAGDAAILVDPLDIKSISSGMQKLLDEKTRQKLVQLGKTRSKLFSWEKAAIQTLKVFEEIRDTKQDL